jgi:coproporphyrinogen III oxidase
VERTTSNSDRAAVAIELVEGLQRRFKDKLEAASAAAGHDVTLDWVEWQRDGGTHGGGHRFVAVETPVFNRVAINVSHVHYSDLPDKKLDSATALSTIIHPRHPRAPSVHMHFSWTEMKGGDGYWRMMADLNPSIPDDDDKARFARALEEASPERYAEASAQGDRYFFIPALDRHRGVTHFYLEAYSTGDFDADRALAERTGQAGIDRYVDLLTAHLQRDAEATDDERARQLAYHTVYLLQVLTLDRGTTSGLLVHDQNDVGIMGSLPAYVDRALLASWEERVPEPQRPLLRGLVNALPDEAPSHVTDDVRRDLAQVVRAHYRAHPEALDLQASGNVVPPTVANHEGGDADG